MDSTEEEALLAQGIDNVDAAVVAIGISELRSACFATTTRSARPLARGRKTKSSCSVARFAWPVPLTRTAIELGSERVANIVALGALAQKSPAFTAINPVQRVPALQLDDGTTIEASHDSGIPWADVKKQRAAIEKRTRKQYPDGIPSFGADGGSWRTASPFVRPVTSNTASQRIPGSLTAVLS